jgi:molybdate transport system ATP-binding protein
MIEIDVELTRGEFTLQAACSLQEPVTGLLGSSGAGKSTLLGIIAGFIRPDRGHIRIDGACLFDSGRGIDVPMHQRRIGMVFQDNRLFPHLNVRDNLRYGLKLLHAGGKRFEYADIVELLEISHLQMQRAHQLSGGEKQRVALGRALLASPRLLLLDEPLASLDVHLKNQILPFLRRVRDEVSIPMLYVSHSINEVLYLTSQVALMQQGRLMGAGNFHDVIQDDRMLTLAHTLGLENVIRGVMAVPEEGAGYSTMLLGEQALHMPMVEGPEGGEVSVSIPASGIALSRERIEGITIQNQLPGIVDNIHVAAGRALVSVNVQGQTLLAEITPRALDDLQIRRGMMVYCLVKAQSVTPLLSCL